jgi:trehalose synthase-fused probable maltokinase
MPTQVTLKSDWQNAFNDLDFKSFMEKDILPAYVNTCRWFAGKARLQTGIIINHIMPMALAKSVSFLLIIEVKYVEGESENYFLPLSFIDSNLPNSSEIHPKGIISLAYCEGKRGFIIDSIYDENFRATLFINIANNQILSQIDSNICFNRGKGLAGEDINTPINNRVLMVEQSNSSLIFGEKYFMKLYRKLFNETNPEVEMVAFLTEHSDFPYIPAFAGSMAWQRDGQPEVTLGMMQRMVENQTDTWSVTGNSLDAFMDSFAKKDFSINESIFEKVELLAKRTAEMHLALYSPDALKEFATQPFDSNYRAFIFARIKKLLDNRYGLIIDNYTKLEPEAQKLAWDFMEAKELIDDFIEEINIRELGSLRTRIHGDYHLGQVLATENDYIIIDFEGEPESSITDRKIMHSPLKDVAGMLRSYHYAISAKFFNNAEVKNQDKQRVARASDRWYGLIQKTFLEKYFSTFGSPHPLFKNNNEINFLMLLYLLEKAVYELGYEVSYRPDWVKIPLKGIVDVVREIEKLRS